MSHYLTTSFLARNFAKRLMMESPIREDKNHSCTHGGSHQDLRDKEASRVRQESCSQYHDHSKEREIFERSTPEKYHACTLLREEAKKAFTDQKYQLACNFYEKILVQLDYTFPEDEEYKAKFREVELSTHQNLALTRFRLGDYRKSISHCNRVLALDASNVKALVRRGMCHLSLCQYEDAEKNLKQAISIENECAAAKEQLRVLEQQRQRGQKSEKALYSAMLGSHPH